MNNEELRKILLNPDYAKSLGIIVHVEVEENGDKYAVLNNGKDTIKIKL
jgi:two-component sensor histidine kinase